MAAMVNSITCDLPERRAADHSTSLFLDGKSISSCMFNSVCCGFEDVPATLSQLSLEDVQALEHFNRTFTRDKDGRYIVKLPYRSTELKLGCYRDYAVKCFHQKYRTLNKKGCWQNFNAAFSKYAELQHAERVPQSDLTKPEAECFYLPLLHGVVKEANTTTKLRVVLMALRRLI